jgi:glycosyltransferase involved in cell wall biosynthesis
MRISVVTCTFNSVRTLADTIKSVRSQTYQAVEHIFVDGGSTDGTLDLIEALAPGARVLHNVRGGISAAMNAGLRAASGEVVAHLHSDDFYAGPYALAEVAAALEKSGAGWAVGDFEYLTSSGRLRGSAVAPLTLHRLGYGNYIPHFSTFAHKELLLNAGGFDESLKYCMDYDLWFRIFSVGSPIYVPHVLAVFRVHDGSVSSANRRKVLLEEMRVRWRHRGAVPFALPRYCYRMAKRWWRDRLV